MPSREDLTIDPKTIMQPWKGDLDQMVERRIIRVLVVPSKTFYFNDKGTQRGVRCPVGVDVTPEPWLKRW